MSPANQNPNDQQNWLLVLLNELGKYTMSIIVIIVLFLLLWVVPQIKDLIVAINQANDHWFVVFIFFASLSVMAFLITTVGTYFRMLKQPASAPDNGDFKLQDSDTKESGRPSIFQVPMDDKEQYIERQQGDITILSSSYEDKEDQQQYIQRMFPKVLGTLLIIIAAFAVNNTYQMIYGEDLIISGNWGLMICLVLLLALLNQKWKNAFTKWFSKFKIARYIPIGIATLCLVTIVILGLFNRGGAEGDIVRLFYALILLAILFLLITTSYNKLIIKFKRRIGAPLIIALVAGALLSYLILFFNPQALKFFTPLPIVMICIIGMYTILNLIKLLGVVLRVPLLGMTLFVSLVLGIVTASNPNFSHYDATSVSTNIQPSQRLELDTYVKHWIADRKADIQNSTAANKFPIVFVSAEGGGSRAGLWSFLIQSYLYDRNPDYFEKYLFAMTGASGGGVGNNMFYAQAYQLQAGHSTVAFKYQDPENGFNYRASNIYNKDYLSTSVASLLGRDLFKSITNMFTFYDRGALLEDEWQTSFDKVFAYDNTGPLGEAYLDIMPKSSSTNILPIVVTNTTHLQSGQRAVISPVSIENDTYNMAVFKDLLAEYPDKDRMIKRSTAMSMNARFPYISPAARIKEVGQFGDAGYYDNIGGTVTRRLAQALKDEIEKDTSLTGKYEIKHLLITNYEGDPKLTYSTQLAAPLSMIWNATFAHPKEMEKTFTNVHNIQSKRTEIPQKSAFLAAFMTSKSNTEDEDVKPFIPLGRYLSDIAVRSLEVRLTEVESELNKIIPEKKP